MLQALQHRGPDASGRFAIEAGGRQVFLGHTRLSIIDLSEAGTQPMFTANRRIGNARMRHIIGPLSYPSWRTALAAELAAEAATPATPPGQAATE